MKFNYKLQRLCGAYYGHPLSTQTGSHLHSQWSGSNLIFNHTGDIILSAVSNRIQVIDLKTQCVRTLPIECRSNIRYMALSPATTTTGIGARSSTNSKSSSSSFLLMVVDVENYVTLINFLRGTVLYRSKFKRRIRLMEFSPNGNYIAFSHGKHIQVWCTPSTIEKQFCPMLLHRTYTGQSDDIQSLEWSSDSSVVLAGSRDCTIRMWTTHTTMDYQPITLSGHKTPIVGLYLCYSTTNTDNNNGSNKIKSCYTISEDGALVTWKFTYNGDDDDDNDNIDNNVDADNDFHAMVDGAVNFFSGSTAGISTTSTSVESKNQGEWLVQGSWSIQSRHYFHQDRATITSTSYCSASGQLLAVAFSSGIFGIYEMPSVSNIHTLSVGSSQKIQSITFNPSGDWLAIGCPLSQQLMVWEWRSETYVIKQRGHSYGIIRCMEYSPDGIIIATGGEDGKLKLWNTTSGFCYVTLELHTGPITCLKFAKPSVIVSASLDGTIKAHDLYRYRTFQTLTTPKPVQFLSLEVDSSGEIIMAGSNDPFHIYTWNLRTGKLLDVYSGHSGPVCSLDFHNHAGLLSSCSWDGTIKVWDIYKGGIEPDVETLQHSTDLVAVSFRPDGKEICSASLGGILSFWDIEHSKLKYEIDGRKDIMGGRKMNDRMASNNNAASRYFTSICYSADGTCLLAGGNSKFVCIYELSQQILLKKFQVTFNRSLDGVLDELNSRMIHAESGILLNDDLASEDETTYDQSHLPGAKRGDDGNRASRVEVLTTQVSFSNTGREWATISQEGLHIYSLDEDMIFDPVSLTESITPESVKEQSSLGGHGKALNMSLHLNEYSLVKFVMEHVPYDSIPHAVKSVSLDQGGSFLERLIQFLSKNMNEDQNPHIEFYLQWSLQILQYHGFYMDKRRGIFMSAFRALYKVIHSQQNDLKDICNDNKYMLDYILDQGRLNQEKTSTME